jgi:hypothetical protein
MGDTGPDMSRCRGAAEQDGSSAAPGLSSTRSGERSSLGLRSVHSVGQLLEPSCRGRAPAIRTLTDPRIGAGWSGPGVPAL